MTAWDQPQARQLAKNQPDPQSGQQEAQEAEWPWPPCQPGVSDSGAGVLGELGSAG